MFQKNRTTTKMVVKENKSMRTHRSLKSNITVKESIIRSESNITKVKDLNILKTGMRSSNKVSRFKPKFQQFPRTKKWFPNLTFKATSKKFPKLTRKSKNSMILKMHFLRNWNKFRKISEIRIRACLKNYMSSENSENNLVSKSSSTNRRKKSYLN